MKSEYGGKDDIVTLNQGDVVIAWRNLSKTKTKLMS